MKKKIIFGFVLFIAIGVATFAQSNKTIAVATFDVISNAVTQDEAAGITELFISELSSAREVTVADRNAFEKIIQEMKFQTSDWSDKNKTAEIGKAINANLIVRGSIMKLGGKYSLSVVMIDVKTAAIRSSSKAIVNSLDEFFYSFSGICNELIGGIAYRYSIGDTGPGGGVIFYKEGDSYYEVSAVLAWSVNWYEAQNICKNYRGGGFSDWYMPSKQDYLKILNSGIRMPFDKKNWYWLSDEWDDFWDRNHAWMIDKSYSFEHIPKDRSIAIFAIHCFQ